MNGIRTVVDESSKNIIIMDVFSRLIKERIVFIDDAIDDEMANEIVAQLLYLDSLSNDIIKMYINSPGGGVTSGLAIYDTMSLIKSPIKTVGIGSVASMAAILLMSGKERTCTPNCRIMIHELSGGNPINPLEDIKIHFSEMNELQSILNSIISKKSNISNPEEYKRDFWMGPQQALSFGIIDYILNGN